MAHGDGPIYSTKVTELAKALQELDTRSEATEALRGVTFEVRRGEIFALLGPNGAGKTTLIEILEGYRKRTSGDALVLGSDQARPTRSWRERIGLVLQECELDPNLTVHETVSIDTSPVATKTFTFGGSTGANRYSSAAGSRFRHDAESCVTLHQVVGHTHITLRAGDAQECLGSSSAGRTDGSVRRFLRAAANVDPRGPLRQRPTLAHQPLAGQKEWGALEHKLAEHARMANHGVQRRDRAVG